MKLSAVEAMIMTEADDSDNFHFERVDDELSLAFRPVGTIPEALAQQEGPFVRLLNLTETELCSFANLELFTNLETLILDKNGLKGLGDCPQLETLSTLWFNNNNVDDLPGFMDSVTANFPNLRYLSMMRNPACPGLMDIITPDLEACRLYRIYALYRLPHLLVLDSTTATEEERKEALKRGQFALKRSHKGVAAAPTHQRSSSAPSGSQSAESQSENERPPIRGSNSFIGKAKSKYDGRNSEGNRFISDRFL